MQRVTENPVPVPSSSARSESSRLGVAREVAMALRPYAVLLGGWLVLFAFWRLVLVVTTWHLHGDATPGLIAGSFLRGLRFDFSMAVRLSVVFALWQLWRPTPGRRERLVVWSVFSLVAFVCLFTLTGEVEFYKEFQMRLGPLALEYFGKPEHNEIVAGMIWHGYPVVRWMLFCLAVWAAVAWLARRWIKAELPVLRARCAIVATVVIIITTVIGSRGGLQGSPLRWGDAVFSQNTYANHMAQNGVFAMTDTILKRGHKKRSSGWTAGLSRDKAFQSARELTLLPGETLIEPGKFALLRRSRPSATPLARRPKNVVLVMMESFTARFCGAVGADFGATPNFDALARDGVLFDRAFSVSTHTAQGVFGTLCSFPNLPEYDGVMKHPHGNQPFRSLPAVLKESGYQTRFIYNGLFSWDNKEGFFRQQGVERFIGRYDYPNPIFVDPDWGVSDEDVFLRALTEISEMHGTGRPFLSLVLTLSNHAPFNMPPAPGLARLTAGGEQNQRLNGVHYADWALGKFMSAARTNEWFADTLFVFTGDHGFGIPPMLTEGKLLHQHVPILFYAPQRLGELRGVRHQTASQLDILPSILGLLGVEAVHQSFGRDLFSLPPNDPGHAYIKASGSPVAGWVEGNEVALLSPGQPPDLHQFDLGFPPSATGDLAGQAPDRARVMGDRLRGFIAAGLLTLEGHLCAPR